MSDKPQREREEKEFLGIISYRRLHYAWTTAEENEWDFRRAYENLGDKKRKCVSWKKTKNLEVKKRSSVTLIIHHLRFQH